MSLLQDLRYAVRLLVKDKWFTLVAAIALALGIGVNNTVFTFVNAVLIRGLPFDDPDRIMSLGTRDARNRDRGLSYLEFQDWRDSAKAFAGMAAFSGQTMNVSDEGRAPERFGGPYISGNAFKLIGEKPVLGRDFLPEDDRPGATPVVILGNGIWKNRYGSDPQVIGRTIKINELPVTVIGVMPEGFKFPINADLWIPVVHLAGLAEQKRDARNFEVFARLAPGVTEAQAQAELNTVAQRLAHDFPATNKDFKAAVMTFNERYNGGQIRLIFLTLMGAVGFVLLIACANVANLLLARSANRSREISVRVSLGATRFRIVRQLLVESVLLAALGGALGAALSAGSLRLINALIPDNTLAYWMRFTLDIRAVGVLCAVSVATVLVFGLAPALHVASTDVNDAIKSGGRGGFGVVRGRRWTAICLAAECGLTMVMLAALVVGVRTALDAGRKFVAVQPDGVLTTWVTLPADRYRTTDARRTFYATLEQRVAALPGTAIVAMATALPLGGAAARTLAIADQPPPPGRTPPTVWTITTSARYFDAIGVATIRGRGFGDRDGLPGYESAIVNQRFADMFFAGQDAVGHRLRLTEPNVPAADAPPLTIVGIVPSIRQRTTSADPDPIVYLPLAAAPPVSAVLFVRGQPSLARTDASFGSAGTSGAAPTASVIRDALHDIDPELPLYRTMSMAQALDGSRWNARVSEWLLYSITVVAIALASLGLYAVIAHAILQRTRELGIRIALGATRGRVVSMVARQSAVHFALGIAAGLVCVFAFARLTEGPNGGQITGYQITSASTLAAVAVLLGVITAVASIAPAWRACRVDPARTLRES
jgi:predicted permease